MTSYEVRFEIWIMAFLNVPTMLCESQHLCESLVMSRISSNLMGLDGVSCDLLGCNMEKLALNACITFELKWKPGKSISIGNVT